MNTTVIFEIISSYGLIAVFLIIALEYACFPLPSEIVLPFSGAYAASQGIPFIVILLISAFAGLFGSLICYLVGRIGGNALLEAAKKKFGKLTAGIEASQAWFYRYGGISVMVGRMLPLCRTYISFIAGLSKQNPFKFITYSFLGITFWNFVLVGLGFKFATHWEIISLYAKRYTYVLLPFVLLLIFIVVCKIKRDKNSGRKTAEIKSKRI
jgi:membrane protein DedA with SNARE-associated domain